MGEGSRQGRSVIKAPLLDTNILIRFVTGEPESQAREVADLIASAEAKNEVFTVPPMVLAEAVFVLTGFYDHPRVKVADTLAALISSPVFRSQDQATMIYALELFGSSKLDFVDCYLAAVSIDEKRPVISFDRDFDKVRGAMRKSPGKYQP